jgi:hypothetical protein
MQLGGVHGHERVGCVPGRFGALGVRDRILDRHRLECQLFGEFLE